MPMPRPYGVGPYGTGPYERYTGTIYEVGAASSIAFQPHAVSYRVVSAVAGATGITFQAEVRGANRVISAIGGATGITFDIKVSGAQRVIVLHPVTRIELIVWGELLETWAAAAGCEGGAWSPSAPCEVGGWAPVAIGAAGAWALSQAPASGWSRDNLCSPGDWKKAA